ncbi:hypothetical protein TVAG_254100 [Trichomonas vaginalis G3]|uniref:Uncharacterized protein n=1 Tax=Trichomonas vaginalis (strain ATCC PRA-98 / G3) TaxID=412133 RepID=A2DMS7_TRIV3|nr:hypothetical protein TVAGG3_0059250 [Trichomonas vaginalis G3]EAY18298.1 hypothetical protein TVAG_254100 [Trichomonas vaginalis G3]KAI5541879.1 hypothetical protein TVAGG3_0059250 [Trichomonas vaginalis G3]|eukprot:XP_001579284.1 hypothetical protein [Trichomonas vaginalis G3]
MIMFSLLIGFTISHKPINVTTRNYTTIDNFNDLFKAMRDHFDSKNLTQDEFIKVTNSSAANSSADYRLPVDCIARDPIEFYPERFVTAPTNSPNDEHHFTIDFLTSKVHLRNYTLLYITQMRYMVQYEVLGELMENQWERIDYRAVDSRSMVKRFLVSGKTYYAYSFPTTANKNYSRFRFRNIGVNQGLGVNQQNGFYTATTAKLLLYGTLYPGRIAHSPIKLKRKEQMLFNFAMFSSL